MRQTRRWVLLGGTCLALTAGSWGQSPPGPLTPPPASARDENAPPPRPAPPRVAPRKTFAGFWELNREDSDDPHMKLHQASRDRSVEMGPTTGSTWPGGGGIPGSRYPGNGRPQNYPQGGPSATEEKMQNLVDPTIRLNVEQREPKAGELQMTGDQGRVTIIYTDGRKADPPSGVGTRVIYAHWDGDKLITEETVEKNGSLTRTFELSKDGLQLIVNLHAVLGKKKDQTADIRFVYDAVNPPD